MFKALILAASFAAISFGQIPAAQKTGSFLNCRYWNGLSEDNRVEFVVGLSEGYSLYTFGRDSDRLSFPDATYGQIAKGTTQLCVDPRNGQIPVAMVMHVFDVQSHGAKPDEVQSLLVSARELASRFEHQSQR